MATNIDLSSGNFTYYQSEEEVLQKLAAIYQKMKVQQAGLVLQEFDPEIASKILAILPAKRVAKIVASMEPKRAAKLLQRWTKKSKKTSSKKNKRGRR